MHIYVHGHSVMSDFVILWTVAHQAPLFIWFYRQEYWNGLPFPFPGDLPDPVIEPASLALVGYWGERKRGGARPGLRDEAIQTTMHKINKWQEYIV